MAATYSIILDGEQRVVPITGINLRALGQTVLLPPFAGRKFVPQAALLRIATKTGTTATAAVIRIGSAAGGFTNVCPAFTVVGTTPADGLLVIPFPATRSAVLLTTGISMDVTTAATGVTVLTADVYLQGLFV